MKKGYLMTTIVLLTIFVVLASVAYVFYPNDINYSDWESYYKLKKDTIDVLFVGSSHSYSTFVTPIVSEALETDCYALGSGNMTIEQSYYTLKEAFKTQSPELIVLEAFCLKHYDTKYASEVPIRFAFDDMRLSQNKIEAIRYNVPDKSERISYLIPFIKYHAHWKDAQTYKNILNIFEKTPQDNYFGFKGYSYEFEDKEDAYDFMVFPNIAEPVPLEPERMELLEDIIKLCKDNQAEVVVVAAPFIYQTQTTYVDQYQMLLSLQPYFDDHHIEVINYNMSKNGLKLYESDLANTAHVNLSGAKKVTQDFSTLLKDHYAYLFEACDYYYEKRNKIGLKEFEKEYDYFQIHKSPYEERKEQ